MGHDDKRTSDGSLPERQPDYEEAITGKQMTQAVGDWLAEIGRLPPGYYTISLVVSRGADAHVFKAWRTK